MGAAAAVGFCGLGGCSAVRLTYNQGPFLAYWWIDGYFDFNAEQSPKVRAALDDWFSWHRATQLTDYMALLGGAQRMVVDNVTPAQVCGLYQSAMTRVERAYEQAVQAMAEIAREMTPAQLRHLEQRYQKSNDELQRDYLKGDPIDRREAMQKQWIERAETVYGRLDETQRQMVATALERSPFDPQRWLVERRSRQHDILRGLRQLNGDKADAATAESLMRALALTMTRSARPDYQAYRQRLQETNCDMAARLHNTTSPAQRQRAVGKLKAWEDDLRSLMREPASTKPALIGSATRSLGAG